MEKEQREELNEAQRLFNRLLTRSNHFADVMNTHRAATAELLAALLAALSTRDPGATSVILASMKEQARATGRPSIDGERALLAHLTLDRLAQAPLNQPPLPREAAER